MAVGKNKKIKTGRKGAKKRLTDPFVRKEWYDVKAPNVFVKRNVGKTCVTKTTGTKIASDALRGRVVEANLADLQGEEEQGFRKMRLRIEDIQGAACLTQFHGMDLTTDKLRSIIRKWHTLIEAHVDVKTLDGYKNTSLLCNLHSYTLRMFAIALTARRKEQLRKTSYAQSSQIRRIRKLMVDIMTREATNSDLRSLVKKFIPESIGHMIQGACERIYPVQNVYVRKVKVLKTPKFDQSKLQELHADVPVEDVGKKVEAAPVKKVVKQAPLVGEAH